MVSLRSLTVLAASAWLLISCRGSKPETASTPAATSVSVTQSMTRLTVAPRFYIDQVGTASNPKTETEIPSQLAGPFVVFAWAADSSGDLASRVGLTIEQNPYPATY